MTLDETAQRDSSVAARALLAVLDHPEAGERCDERLLEALMLHGLRSIPQLGPRLLGCPADAVYAWGRRGQADIVAYEGDTIRAQLEVKTRAAVNGRADWNQMDRYAAAAPAEAGRFLLTTAAHGAKLDTWTQVDWTRWTRLLLPDVARTVADLVGQLPASDGTVETLACALARLDPPRK